ncbi:dolichol kinase [Ignisphaera sp. 4213-co]|uniref:Dolichol kinase n=1 Tax=Ignisphaera cupida TaxID=3050454 RepID=A0ABD4Z4K8_9CREN|nr:dolichol kinase [Ignisphaera sp. 4213-co]MDK6028139.1 dolichol kinase [Ignisphaera sp. 4213-co]
MTSLKVFVFDFAIAIPLFIYVLLVVSIFTRRLYSYLIGKGFRKNVVVYYNRKIIHISTGGFIALLVPILFKEPFTPFVFAIILAFITLYPHIKGKELEWFQTKDNVYEVNFCIAWGASILVLWLFLNNPWKSIIPALFISFGDAATGIVRNAVFGRRTKHWIGNLAMAAVTIPMGYFLAGFAGVVAAILATFVERFEFGYIDDNALIAITSTITLIALK